MPEKPEAHAYSASANVQQAASPLTYGDKCFLCNNSIAEDAPRGFYQPNKYNTASMMLCHRLCLDRLEACGNDPAEYFKKYSYQKPITPEPEPTGPANIQFPSFEAMADHIKAKGPLPDGVNVYVGELKVR